MGNGDEPDYLPCHVCGEETSMACSDCRIDFGVSIHVCAKRECRTAHELKCSHALKERLDTYRKALDAIWRWCQLQPDDNAVEAVCHIEQLVEAALGMSKPNMVEWTSLGDNIEFKTPVDAVKGLQLIIKLAEDRAKEILAAKAAEKDS